MIPNLTYENFKAFHDKFYHPSNARIFFYGDDDPDERLRRMDGYLQEYQAIQVDSKIPLQPRSINRAGWRCLMTPAKTKEA